MIEINFNNKNIKYQFKFKCSLFYHLSNEISNLDFESDFDALFLLII